MNRATLARVAFALAGVVLVVGAVSHASAYPRVARAVEGAAGLAPFFGQSLKLLWLGDFTTLLAVGVACLALAARPGRAGPGLLALLVFIPAATGAWLYAFLGNFLPAHLMAAASALLLAGGCLRGAQPRGGEARSSTV